MRRKKSLIKLFHVFNNSTSVIIPVKTYRWMFINLKGHSFSIIGESFQSAWNEFQSHNGRCHPPSPLTPPSVLHIYIRHRFQVTNHRLLVSSRIYEPIRCWVQRWCHRVVAANQRNDRALWSWTLPNEGVRVVRSRVGPGFSIPKFRSSRIFIILCAFELFSFLERGVVLLFLWS